MDSKRHLNDLWKGLSVKEQNKLCNGRGLIENNQQPIDSSALRCMGVITTKGYPFAKVFLDYLKACLKDQQA